MALVNATSVISVTGDSENLANSAYYDPGPLLFRPGALARSEAGPLGMQAAPGSIRLILSWNHQYML